MYDMKYPGRRTLKARFKHGVREFVTYAMSRDVVKREGGIRCPCLKCSCVLIIKSPEDVIDHLENVGFMDDYYVWRHHGEQEPQNINVEFMVDTHASSSGVRAECENFGHMEDMVGDTLGVNLSYERGGEEEIIPNEKALKFYSMMEEVNKPLFEGSSDSKLSMCVRLLAAKSNWNVPEDCLEFFSKMMLDATPVKDNLPTSYYDAKRLVSKLGLEVKKIDCCVQGCMLFYDNEFGTNDGALEECKFCNAPRYQVCNNDVHRTQKRVSVKSMFYLPIIPRLQRLFASMETASQMTWHYYNKTNSDVMRHPCDGLAWKHFDAMYRDFAEDPRPSNPTDGIDVYLQPLIDDLKRLWIGELTYDIARKENFTMRAALMWTINDFPAYGMLSGWSTHVWPQLLAHWNKDPTFAKRSKANVKNRNSRKDDNLHTQGCVSVATYVRYLERQLGRKPFINEVHKATHIIQGTGDYVDARTRDTQAKYDGLVLKYIERHPEYSCNADLPEAVQLHLWDLASGPGNDYRRYGYGRLAPNFQHKSLHYIPTGEEQYSHPTTIPPKMQKTIETMVQQLESQTVELQRRAQREQELTERLNKDIEDRRPIAINLHHQRHIMESRHMLTMLLLSHLMLRVRVRVRGRARRIMENKCMFL
ncbi:hypothetical protein TSUD_248850 [Trifolium subterraneum]|uniref:Transposase-associated domain-containing protein n=1 Tax=Trifolium subterraneum TaxID=3900 RepID=A0A2Z6LL27_TRISU|nr:hypothetical protein TSUD_248850 [Trifolium subterraneum]